MNGEENNIVDLDRLRADAAALDAGGMPLELASPDAPIPPAEPPKPDPAAELAAVITVCVGILAPFFPSLPGVYAGHVVQAVAQATAPVLEKYGVNMGGLFDRYKEEIQCAIVVVPVALATRAAIEKDLAARKTEDKKPEAPRRSKGPGEPDDLAAIRSL